ncbi:alpha-2-macroglobulin-like isoform X2 [Mugil cephalus]|uniref:alpha-2-macroglobulin-like isoform X2 n=1 Tax=Mugil cephalus TaxID=48193 RepID=UPI001FB5EC34|nr:alpha-2-macroglobulin-like isoform X2 [Mugil cephalus]
MGHPGIQMWTWTLCFLLSCMGQVVAGPQYMVAIPAVLEAGAETKFCASLLQPSETLVMTVTLMSEQQNTTLFTKSSSKKFHICSQFKAPLVQNEEVQEFKVEVRGGTFHSREVRKVMIKVYKPMTFVQTDKPIYLPGQTVHFRVITLDTKFRPTNQVYNTIALMDPNNTIGQWLNETSNGKILQLSYSLNSEAKEGDYQVIVSVGEDKINHYLKVEKYVLPKFDVKINGSEQVSIGQEEIDAEICAKYTFGQPVPGSVTVEMCRPLRKDVYSERVTLDEIIAPCHTETKQADETGCTTFTFKMSTFIKIDPREVQNKLEVTAEVEEEGTEISYLAQEDIKFSYVLGKLSFIDTPKIYTKGSNVEGKVKAIHYNNTPIPDIPVYLFEGERWSPRLLQNLTTDSSGVATFTLSTDDFSGDVKLHISKKPSLKYPKYRTAFYESGVHTLSLSEPSSPLAKTVSSLEVKKQDEPLPCDTEVDISVQYTIVGEAQGSVDVMYLALSRGAIITQDVKQIQVNAEAVNEGEVSFKLRVSPEMAPEVQLVAYSVLPSDNVIAHHADFSTEKCFSNKVSLEFSPSSAVPGEEITMQITAQPDSLCGVSAIDQSVLIEEPGKTLDADKIFALLPIEKESEVPHEIQDPTECLHVRPRRYIMPYPSGIKDYVHAIFENVGLKMATNMLIRMPACVEYKGEKYLHSRYVNRHIYGPTTDRTRSSVRRVLTSPAVAPPPVETVRTFFPETWIWNLIEVGESGRKDVPLTVPDTITTWETETFCLSPQGFGLAPRKEITVFQPFFLELSLPYSIVRGEQFELKATVFNYLTSCLMLTVTPALSLDYTLTPLSGDLYTSCLCGNERKTLSWTMIPLTLGVVNVTVTAEALVSHISCENEIVTVPERGRIDVVTKSLIIKAEGTEMTKTYNWLLCPKGDTLTEATEIQLPENVIDGSARASVSVLGDILARALKNPEGLLQMPYGCGEQNMALLAPSIYILQYLKDTQQLTPTIKEVATYFLTRGYQRQLNYKDIHGAYSTFVGGVGNTWLTAFVLRAFTKAQSFIYIDPEILIQSKTWLNLKQQENGCFRKSGKLFNNAIKGGVSDEVTLSAYITAAFLEMNMSASDPVVNKSLSCLRESITSLTNTYTTALMAYVFTLAGDMETRSHLLQHLDKIAVKQDGFIYWTQTATEFSPSLSVEISSYVLMAKLGASPTAEDVGYTSSIIKWLIGQQNEEGGFESTQDTVVALQALALYSTLLFSPGGSSTVTVQGPSDQLTFDVNPNNKLLYQEKTLRDVRGKYSVEVKGTACAAAQISLHYNIPTPADVTTLSVEVKPQANCTRTAKRPKLTLKLKCLYTGEESSSDMVILDIKILSGFIHTSSSKLPSW